MNDLETRLRHLQSDYPAGPLPRTPSVQGATLTGPAGGRRRTIGLLGLLAAGLAVAVAIAAFHPVDEGARDDAPPAAGPILVLPPGSPIPLQAVVHGAPDVIFHETTDTGNESWIASGPEILVRSSGPGTVASFGDCRLESSFNEMTHAFQSYDAGTGSLSVRSFTSPDVVRQSWIDRVRALQVARHLPASTPANGTFEGRPVILIDAWAETDPEEPTTTYGYYLDPATHVPLASYYRSASGLPKPDGTHIETFEALPATAANLRLFDLRTQYPTAQVYDAADASTGTAPTSTCVAG